MNNTSVNIGSFYLKQIEEYELPDCIMYIAPFSPYRLKDPENKNSYQFPKGTLLLKYDKNKDSFSAPRILESYSHPILMKKNEPYQAMDVPWLRELHGEDSRQIQFIIDRLALSLKYLPSSEGDKYYSTPHKLSDNVFDKFLIKEST